MRLATAPRRHGAACRHASTHVVRTAAPAFVILNRECHHWDGKPGSCIRGGRCEHVESHITGRATRANELMAAFMKTKYKMDRNAQRPSKGAAGTSAQGAVAGSGAVKGGAEGFRMYVQRRTRSCATWDGSEGSCRCGARRAAAVLIA